MTKCKSLNHTVLLEANETNTGKPLERAYQLLESVVSNLQVQLQAKKEEQKEETSMLFRQQYTSFSEAHKVLQEHLEESTTTEEVLCSWYTHYGQVFQQAQETHKHIKKLENQQGFEDAMRRKIQE